MTDALRITDLRVTLGAREVLRDLSLTVERGALLGLLGRSGTGKTTLLRAIAGLAKCTGSIKRGDQSFDQMMPSKRKVALVFQDLALWPHLNAEQHLKLVAKSLPRPERAEAIAEWMTKCDLHALARQRPDQLSGGEQRRLALARALLPRPDVLLLDEPFAGIDRAMVDDLKQLIATLHRDRNLITMLVSHDWRDMEGLVDRLAVMEDGKITLEGTPGDVQAQSNQGPMGPFFR